MRTCVIFNPTAKGDKARNFRCHLDEIGAAATLKLTREVGDARALAAEAVKEGFETVVAAGGDGTLNEVLNGIGDVRGGFQRTRLGVLPLGTVNVFARELKIPRKLRPAWETICVGRETIIDLPCVEFSLKGVRARRFFAQLAGAGLDARAIELVNWNLKKRIGPLAYVVAGLSALMQPQTKIEVSDGERSVTGELVLIGNGRLYGGEYAIFSAADLRDGLLEVCVFPKVNWWTLMRCGPSLLFNNQLPLRLATHFKGSSITLCSSVPVALEVDGELIGHLPAKFSVQRSSLRVITP